MKPGRLAGEVVDVDLLRERLAARVDLEDLRAPLAVRPVDDHLAVEAARPQQRRVEDVGPVRGGDQDDVVLHLEAVHLDQQLVQRLLALVVAAAEAGAAVTADGVDLVHEDDAGRVLLGLLEEVTHARGADADEHLDEVRARDREERHAGLAGDRAREQRLAGAGRAVEQHALRDPGAERLELLRVLEELLDLLQLLDRFVDACDVAERDLRRVDRQPFGARLAEAHHARAAALDRVHQEYPEREQQDEGQYVGQQREPARAALALHRTADTSFLRSRADQPRLVVCRVAGLVLGLAVELRDVERVVPRLERDALDLAVLDLREELAEVGLRLPLVLAEEALREERQHDHDQDREGRVLEESAHVPVPEGKVPAPGASGQENGSARETVLDSGKPSRGPLPSRRVTRALPSTDHSVRNRLAARGP